MRNDEARMNNTNMPNTEDSNAAKSKEVKAFLFIIICFFPILTTLFVGAYGFATWMMQLIFGLPGHG